MLKIRLGTRGSQLALWQSRFVKSELEKLSGSGDFEIELVVIQTQGDITSGPLKEIGGQGLFTSRLQAALRSHEVDFAVHSLKDMPTQMEPGLELVAVPARADARDVLVSSGRVSLESLSTGAVIGTGSVRRRAQLLNLRRDLQVRDIRGNLDTRIDKAMSGEFDAVVLAKAGLDRLGWSDKIGYVFEMDQMLPAIGQGALGIEMRNPQDERDLDIANILRQISHESSFACVMAERHLLRTVQGGCLAPVGAMSRIEDGELELTGVVLDPEGHRRIEATSRGPVSDPDSIGEAVAHSLLSQGASSLMAEAR